MYMGSKYLSKLEWNLYLVNSQKVLEKLHGPFAWPTK